MKGPAPGPDHAGALALLVESNPGFVFVPVVGDEARLKAIQKRVREVAPTLGLRWCEPDEFEPLDKGVLKALQSPTYGHRKVLWAQGKSAEDLSALLPSLNAVRKVLARRSTTVLLLAVSPQAYVHELVTRAKELARTRQALWT